MGKILAENVEEKQWKNEELRSAEGALPRLKVSLRKSVEIVSSKNRSRVTASTLRSPWT